MTDAGWNDLTQEERQGMTREYFEALEPEARQALAADICLEAECTRPRWRKAGSFRCEQHTRELSDQAMKAREPT